MRLELEDIKQRIEKMQSSINFMISAPIADRNGMAARGDLLDVMVAQVMEDVEEGLSLNMVKRCNLREPCRAIFTNFLQKNASLLEKDTVREEVIITSQDELDRLRETAPHDKCKKCFHEVTRLFGKQVRLMRSMRIFSTTSDKKLEISEIPEDSVVRSVLDPVANRHRLQILKAISQETSTFSHLSEITGLKGGNLLFHIQKLLDSGMTMQRHGRGDYMITEKGFKVLKGVSDVYQMLKT